MKNFKRILALVLTLMFIVGSCASLSAFSGSTTTSWYAKAVSWIENTGVDTIGATADETIDRETFVKWVAKIESTYVDDSLWKDEVASTTFSDVTEENYRAAIAYSQQRGFIRGYDATTFGPNDVLTFAQACAVIVRVLGAESYVEAMDDNRWEYNYINIANKLGAIDSEWVDNVGFYVPEHEMTKGEAAYLLWLAAQSNIGAYADIPGGRSVLGLAEGKFKEFGKLEVKTGGVLALVTVLNRAPIAQNSGTQVFGSAWRSRSTSKGSNTVYMRYNMPGYAHIMVQPVTPTDAGWTWIQNQYATLNTDTDLWIHGEAITGEPAMADYWSQYDKYGKGTDAYWDAILTTYRLPYSKDIVTAKSTVGQGLNGSDQTDKLAEMGLVTLKLFDATTGNFTTEVTFENTTDSSGKITKTGAEKFQEIVRTSLGLSKTVGDTESFSLFDYIQKGSVVNLKVEGKDPTIVSKIKGVTAVDSHVVDTFRVLKATSNLAIYNAGLANSYGTTADNVLVLRSSYDETKDVTSWSGSKLTIGGKEYSILTPGSAYSGAQNELAVYDFVNGNGTQIKADAAKTLIINAVEGEIVTVYSDMDGDGYYDVAAVTEVAPFKVSTDLNAAPAGNYTVKGIPSTGTVVLNATVDTDKVCNNTDPYTIDTSKKTGKMQLVLATSDARHIAGFFDADMDFYAGSEGLVFNLACVDPSTHVVDLAAFQTGYIKNASSSADGGYYTLTITTADGDVTVEMPAIGSIATTQKMDVEAFGAKTTKTLASKGWMTFLTDFYSANFRYDFVDKDGKYIYTADGETAPYVSDSLEIVAYYKGKTTYTSVPTTAKKPVAGTKYAKATPVLLTATSFATDVDYYELIETYAPAAKYSSTTEYWRVTATDWADAMDSLISWKDGVKYATKDDATNSQHRQFAVTPSDWDTVDYMILSGTDYVTVTNFIATQTYYIGNPQAWTKVDTDVAPKFASISDLWILSGSDYRPATYTDFNFKFDRDVNYYDENGNLITTTSFVSGTDYYLANALTYAEHSKFNAQVTVPTDTDYFTKNGDTYEKVTAGTKFDPAKTYYTKNPQTYKKVTITEFDPAKTYYTMSGTDYVEVDQIAEVDPTATIRTISGTDFEYVGIVSESEFVTDSDFYFATCTTILDLSAPAAKKEDKKKYYSLVTASDFTTLTSFATDTYYLEQVATTIEKTLVTAEKKAEMLADTATETDFVALTRKVRTVLGYTDDLAEDEIAKITYIGKEAGVFQFQSKEEIDKKVSSWMTGQYVDFVEKDGKVIVALNTIKTGADDYAEGFVVSTVKGTDNTYTVTIAKTGDASVHTDTYYLTDMTLAELQSTYNADEYLIWPGDSTYKVEKGVESAAAWNGVSIQDYNKAHKVQLADGSYIAPYTEGDWIFYEWGAGFGTNEALSDVDRAKYGIKLTSQPGYNYQVNKVLKDAFYANKNAGAVWYNAYGPFSTGRLEVKTVTEDNVCSYFGVSTWKEAAAKIISGQITYSTKGSVGASEFKVRASASSIWDSANNEIYRTIYGGEVVTGLAEGEAITQNNLIYVSMTKDGGEYSIMRVITPDDKLGTETGEMGLETITTSGLTGSKDWAQGAGYSVENSYKSGDGKEHRIFQFVGYYHGTTSAGEANENAWLTDGITVLLSSEKSAALSTAKAKDNDAPYQDVYVEEIATDAEYYVHDGKFDVKFATVGTRTKTITYTPVVDKIVGGRYVLVTDAEGNALKADSDAGKVALADDKYVNINGNVHWELIPGEYKYAGQYTSVTTYSDVTDTEAEWLSDYDLDDDQRATMNLITSVSAMKREDKGYIPGYYFVTINGTTYTSAGSTKVIMMTPSNEEGKVVGQVTTIKDLADNGSILFATRYQIAATGTNLTALTVIGELIGEAPIRPVPETKIVYLGSSAETILEAEEVGTSYFVRTSTPAYNLDGTEFGYIYREYDTTSAEFAKAVKNNSFDFMLGNSGCFFEVSAEGKILNVLGSLYETMTSAKFNEVVNGEQISYTYDYTALKNTLDTKVFKTATITSVENGQVLATVGGKKNVDIANWNVKFVYTDVDGEQLLVAGDNTAVSIFKFDVAIENGLTSAYKTDALARETAKKYSTGYSAETKKLYADAYADAAAALETAKQTTADKYFNGAFWGTGSVANSPIANYFSKVKDSFGRNASLAFQYVEVDGVYYVIVPTFVLG